MTANDDELAQIAADDALLTAIAADHGTGDDAADALLTEIVHAVEGLGPSDAPGGSGRRGGGRGRRGGLWGVTLGVSIAVAAGGGLSAAATDRLPDPVQRFVVEVGQAPLPADASQLLVTPTTPQAPSAVLAVRAPAGTASSDNASFGSGGGGDGGDVSPATAPPVRPERESPASWWQAGSAPTRRVSAHEVREPAGTITPLLRDNGTAPSSRTHSWWAPQSMTDPSRASDPSRGSDSSPEPTPTPTRSAASTPQATTPSPAPTRTPAQTQTPVPTPTAAAPPSPTSTPTLARSTAPPPAPTSEPWRRSGHGYPSPGIPASPHATTPTHPNAHTRR